MSKKVLALILGLSLVCVPVTAAAEGETLSTEDVGNLEVNTEEEMIQEEGAGEEINEEETESDGESAVEPDVEESISLRYKTHVQKKGWQEWSEDGQLSGSTGESLRMEAFVIDLGSDELNSQIEYRAHVQRVGWQEWVSGGEVAGTTGESLRVEAVQIRLTGELEEKYNIYYTTHVSNIGNMDWVCNGNSSGSQGLSLRMEAMKISLYPKDAIDAPECGTKGFRRAYTESELSYSAHVQQKGDLAAVNGNRVLGTVGEGLRMEGVNITLDTSQADTFDGGISYCVHVQGIGWQEWKENGAYAGTTGESRRLEAIRIKLTGEAAQYFNIYYRTQIQSFGWMGWASNGEKAGSENISRRMEAIQIVIVPKKQSQSEYSQSTECFRDTYVYQNPSEYLQIKHVQKVLTGGDYELSSGYMGLKVAKVQRKLGLGVRRAIMDSDTIAAVKRFQKNNGLEATGVVDLETWEKMGFSEKDWNELGAYASPLKTNPASTREDCIEAMIDTAYSYLGTEYIIGASGKPGTGADCSGLVMQALYSAGIDPAPVSPIRHSQPGYEYESRNLWNLPMKHVSYSQRQRGDLIFYSNSSGTIIHVAIYLGDDKVIESWPDEVVVWPIKNSQRSIIKGVARPFV